MLIIRSLSSENDVFGMILHRHHQYIFYNRPPNNIHHDHQYKTPHQTLPPSSPSLSFPFLSEKTTSLLLPHFLVLPHWTSYSLGHLLNE